jgi:NAD(P)-dependent dehydrogenase (short-subunit alcohol dehydrogenase family)
MMIEKKQVLITGAAIGGIGEAILNKISEQNNQILVTSLEMSDDRFPNTKSIATDCSTETGIKKLENWIKNETGSIDVLINAIGGSLASKNPLEVDSVFFNKVINVNLTSAILLTQMATRLMKTGSIVHIVSTSAYEASLDKMSYGIAKAGLVYFIRTIAQVLAPDIRINGVSPTYVFTERHNQELKQKAEQKGIPLEQLISNRIAKQLIKQPLLPEDLNEMIEFAATTPLMTGKILDASLGRIY